MSARVEWNNHMKTTNPMTTGQLPKKPVIWRGEVFLQLPGGIKDVRQWISRQPMTTDQARVVLGQLLNQLIGEHGKDSAVHSGFVAVSR